MPSPVTDPAPSANASPPNIRLVDTSQLEPRAIVACVFCRQRKIKCSGDKPVCVKCQKLAQECVYPAKYTGKRNKGKRKEADGEGIVSGSGKVDEQESGSDLKRRKVEGSETGRANDQLDWSKRQEARNPPAASSATANSSWPPGPSSSTNSTFQVPTSTSSQHQLPPPPLQPPQKWNYGIPEYSPSDSSQLSLNPNLSSNPHNRSGYVPPQLMDPSITSHRHQAQSQPIASTSFLAATRTPSQSSISGVGSAGHHTNGNGSYSHHSGNMALPLVGDGPSPGTGRRRIKMRVPFFR